MAVGIDEGLYWNTAMGFVRPRNGSISTLGLSGFPGQVEFCAWASYFRPT
jgi:hypothetical protein